MDLTLLELHLHDASIELASGPPSREGAGKESDDTNDQSAGGRGKLAALPVVIGLLFVVVAVARRLRRAAPAEDLE
jgi:hypothetical protein